MKNPKKILMWSGIVIELAGVLLIAKATATDTSPAFGIVMLGIGLIVMVIAKATKAKTT